MFRDNLWLVVLSFTLSQIGQRSVQGVFWAIPPIFLGGTAAAGCIGLINALGNLGGDVGPSLMGALRQATGTYSRGLLVLACAVVETAIVISLRLRNGSVVRSCRSTSHAFARVRGSRFVAVRGSRFAERFAVAVRGIATHSRIAARTAVAIQRFNDSRIRTQMTDHDQ